MVVLFLAATPSEVAFSASGPGRSSARKVAVLSCDGAGAQMVERMIAAGAMPHLAAMRAQGVMADHARTNFASKTAAGHAALWTGTFGNRNGVTANQVPRQPLAEHTILEVRSGYSAEALEAEPLFVTAAREGKQVLALNVSQSAPVDVYGPQGRFGAGLGDRLSIFNGFFGMAGDDALIGTSALQGLASRWVGLPHQGSLPPLEWSQRIALTTLYGVLLDDPVDPALGYDTVLLAAERDGKAPLSILKPSPSRNVDNWSGPITVQTDTGPATTYFRLFALAPDGGGIMLYHTPPARHMTNRGDWVAGAAVVQNGFVDGGAGKLYFDGALGRTLAEGGDGTAEARYMDTVRFSLHQLSQTARFLLSRRQWDLFMNYIPFPDEAEHLWYGYVTPDSASYDPRLAAPLGALLKEVFGEVDRYIGALRQSIPKDAALLLVSDHGMAPTKWDFRPNVVLKQAGLLNLGPDGRIDLSRTQAMYALTDGAYVVVNSVAHKGGIVPMAEVPSVLAKVRAAFRTVRVKTPAGIVSLVRLMLEPTPAQSLELGVGGRFGGQMYLDLQPGYYFDADATAESPFRARPSNSSGSHIFDSRRPELFAMFYAAGPEFKRGAKIGGIRNIDVAPTVSRLLGIRPPAQATGRVLVEAFEPQKKPTSKRSRRSKP